MSEPVEGRQRSGSSEQPGVHRAAIAHAQLWLVDQGFLAHDFDRGEFGDVLGADGIRDLVKQLSRQVGGSQPLVGCANRFAASLAHLTLPPMQASETPSTSNDAHSAYASALLELLRDGVGNALVGCEIDRAALARGEFNLRWPIAIGLPERAELGVLLESGVAAFARLAGFGQNDCRVTADATHFEIALRLWPQPAESTMVDSARVQHTQAASHAPEPDADMNTVAVRSSAARQIPVGDPDLLDHLSDPVVELARDGRLVYVNLAGGEALGRSTSSLIGLSFVELILPADQARCIALFQKVVETGEEPTVSFRSPRVGQSPIEFEATVRVFGHDAEHQRIVAVCRDVTQRTVDGALERDRNAQYRALVEGGPHPAAIMNSEGETLFSNRRFKATFGPGATLETIAARVPPDARHALSNAWYVRLTNDDSGSSDFCYQSDSGAQHWYTATWEAFRNDQDERLYSFHWSDITRPKQVELALRQIARGIAIDGLGNESSVVEMLGKALDLDRLAIGLIDPETDETVNFVAAWEERGAQTTPQRIALAGLPEETVAGGEACVHPGGLRALMPAVRERLEQDFDSFAGCPIQRSDGCVIGLIAGYALGPIRDTELTRSTLSVLASHLAADADRCEADRVIRENQERFDALAASADDILVEIDAEGRVLYVSQALHSILGYDADTAVGTPSHYYVHPADMEAAKNFQRLLTSRSDAGSVATRARAANGEWRWFESRATPYIDSAGEHRAVIISRDVTQRRRAEIGRDLLHRVVQESADLILVSDSDGRIVFTNEATTRSLDLDSAAARETRSVVHLLSAADAETWHHEIVPMIQCDGQWSGELDLIRPLDGVPIPTDATISLVEGPGEHNHEYLAFTLRDLRSSRRAERHLRETEARYRLLADNPYDLIVELDGTGQILQASPNHETLLGESPVALLGTAFEDLVEPDDREEFRKHLAEALESRTTARAAFGLVGSDAEKHWVETTIQPNSVATNPEQQMALLIARDVTERRIAEEDLRERETRLGQAQKMEAVGRLAGGIAHDFNNLLTAIIGYGDLVLEEIGADHVAHRDAQEILRAAERAGGLTRQLLAFSRRQVLQQESVDLNAILADVDRMMRRLIGENIELVTILDGELDAVNADPGQIEQVIVNLVVNARDAMPQGGRLELETRNFEATEPIPTDSGVLEPGAYVRLQVSDSGIGMDEATRAQIFEPFFTTKMADQGTGLGLATVYGIVSQSGGQIQVRSERDQGTSFEIYLPAHDGSEQAQDAHIALDGGRGNETILLVEDSDAVRRLVQRTLERHGYKVLTAESATAALRHCSRHPDPIDLLLTDVVLPRITGPEIARRAVELRPGIRVLYMSGFTDDTLLRHGLPAGTVDLLEKPFTPATAIARIRAVLDAPPLDLQPGAAPPSVPSPPDSEVLVDLPAEDD